MSAERRIALLELDMGWSIWLTDRQMPFSLGRNTKNSIYNTSHYISRNHCTINWDRGKVTLTDHGSMNGTVVSDKHIRNSTTLISERSCILLSDMLLWITPCDATGKLKEKSSSSTSQNNNTTIVPSCGHHGVCLVDVCNSVEMNLHKVSDITQSIRAIIVSRHQEKILLLKSLGDGYLIVYTDTSTAIKCARRLLDWQESPIYNPDKANIRIAIDSGITYPAHGHDRIGLPICRASRFEKTQFRDIEIPGPDLNKLKPRNRCLLSSDTLTGIQNIDSIDIYDIGKRHLKGFAEKKHDIYQLLV